MRNILEAIASEQRAFTMIIRERQNALRLLNSVEGKLPEINVATVSMSSYSNQLTIYLPSGDFSSFNDGALANRLDNLLTASGGDPEDVEITDDPNNRKRVFEWLTQIDIEDPNYDSVLVRWTFTAHLADDSTCQVVVDRIEHRTVSKWVEVVEETPIMRFVCPDAVE
jgi:hypothetical protein